MSSYNAAEELLRCYEGDPWHGPSLKTILAGLTPERAARKPIAEAHSAWEILMHIDAWNRVVLKRLDGEVCQEPPENFPQPQEVNEKSWRLACEDLERTLRLIAERMASAPENDPIQINGVVHHLIYHSGQIALLSKAV